MTIGFFTVFRRDPQHQLHATALVRGARVVMPDVPIVQLTDESTPIVADLSRVSRLPDGPMLQRRLEHYATCVGEWLLIDTDVSIHQDVRLVFDEPTFDVAVTDRHWPHVPQAEDVMHTMPFNTGVVFSRSAMFWQHVLAIWHELGTPQDWMSEQRAVYGAIRSGLYRVKILPGMTYNYPPMSEDDHTEAALYHWKGPRKAWLTKRIYASLAEAS